MWHLAWRSVVLELITPDNENKVFAHAYNVRYGSVDSGFN